MAEPAGFTTAIQTKLYHSGAAPATENYAGVNALAIAANEVKHTREMSDLEQSGNPITFVEFGKSVQTSVAGPTPLGEFSFTFAVDFSDAKHKALADSLAGTSIYVVIMTTVGSNKRAYYVHGDILGVSLSQSSGDVKTVTVSMSLEDAPVAFPSS